jgi:hypothetical protein
MMSDEEVESAEGGESSINELDNIMEEDDASSSEDTPLQYNYEYIPSSDKNTVLNDKQRERIQKIEDAATNIQRVLQKYGDALPSINPNDIDKGSWEIDSSSPWVDPSLAIKEIISAREELCKAWDRDDVDDGERVSGELMDGINAQTEDKDKWWKSVLHKEDNSSKEIDSRRSHINNHKDGEPPLTKEEEQQFKEIYMEWATNAYSVELNALREGELGTLTSARRKQKSTSSAGSKNDKSAAPAVELDPTQYSFIVENNKRRDVKKEVEQVDVKVLGDMMASGSYTLSNTEKRMLLQARQRAIERSADSSNTETDTDGISLHERRKLELGFSVE